jgi:alkylation response protein AidB-like acyl-CoA dehydrogenase
MISYEFDDEHAELRRTVEEFARDVVAPVIGGYYERGEFPYDIVAQMGKLGLFGLPFGEEFGGMSGDYFALGLALEELARVDSSVAITLETAVSLSAMPIYLFGTDEQRGRWLPALCAGGGWPRSGLPSPAAGRTSRAGCAPRRGWTPGHDSQP